MSATSRFFLWSILFTLLSCWTVKPETSQPAIENDDIPYNLEKGNCADRPYKTHLFSEDPLVIYIESFVSTDEASQLVALR
jgi:prolyl 4-hydroxylase